MRDFYIKACDTVLLAVEEDIPDGQLEQINKALKNHKDFSCYKMVNWVVYHSIHGRGAGDGASDDDDEDYFGVDSVEVADNLMRTPRTAIVQQRKKTADHVAKT